MDCLITMRSSTIAGANMSREIRSKITGVWLTTRWSRQDRLTDSTASADGRCKFSRCRGFSRTPDLNRVSSRIKSTNIVRHDHADTSFNVPRSNFASFADPEAPNGATIEQGANYGGGTKNLRLNGAWRTKKRSVGGCIADGTNFQVLTLTELLCGAVLRE
jgi:hypothetical protein